MSKKNIDKLFQEKFKDFKEIPDEKVWDAISESLEKKKSRRVIPFWWKLGGVAAVLAIIMTIVNPFESDNTVDPVITDIDKTDVEISNEENDSKDALPEGFELDPDQVADKDEVEARTDLNTSKNLEADIVKTNGVEKKSNSVSPKYEPAKKSQLATFDSEKSIEKKEAKTPVSENSRAEVGGQLNGVVVATDYEKPEENTKSELEEGQLNKESNINSSAKESLAIIEEKKEGEEIVVDVEKKSIFEEVEKQNEEEVEKVAKGAKGKWSIGANLAPVYFDSFGEGSPIDPSFSSNSKSGEVNMSYGLSVAYGVSSRLRLRTGINKVDYSYNTNEIEFSPSLDGAFNNRLSFVDYSPASENVIVESKKTNTFFASENAADEGLSARAPTTRNGTMAQEFGYIEIPVELDYALIDKRFGVNLVGGISSMFLTSNSVALNSSNETVVLGEANNLNEVNFSTNVGFGLNYKVTPKVLLNVEPVFKYQLNTFSDAAGSFNPFSIGVYSGLNFRF